MKLDQIKRLFQCNQAELDHFAVKSLAVFGSVARGEARPDSDLDVLVEFTKPVGLFEFIRLKQFLENLTSCKVDLVTPDALHPAMKESILNEAIHVC